MASHSSNDELLRELKHDSVPGYLMAFSVASAVMGIYLAIILLVSPGPAKSHYGEATSNAKSVVSN